MESLSTAACDNFSLVQLKRFDLEASLSKVACGVELLTVSIPSAHESCFWWWLGTSYREGNVFFVYQKGKSSSQHSKYIHTLCFLGFERGWLLVHCAIYNCTIWVEQSTLREHEFQWGKYCWFQLWTSDEYKQWHTV